MAGNKNAVSLQISVISIRKEPTTLGAVGSFLCIILENISGKVLSLQHEKREYTRNQTLFAKYKSFCAP